MIKRCSWLNLNNKKYVDYHDIEWGEELHDDNKLFEILVLEGAQAGLSWEIVLNKRENYKKALDNYNLDLIINYDDNKIKELLNNNGIIKNKLKINSIIKNAKAFKVIQKKFGSFDNYIWAFVNFKQIKNHFKNINEIPSQTALSQKISKDLKNYGMSFVGPTIIYSFMQAVGIVCDHEIKCFKYKK